MRKQLAALFDRSFWRGVLPLALPIALQNLLMTSFRLIDTLMIGRLGDVSIAAVGLAGYASFLVELISFGMASGSAVFVAQYHGAENKEGILRTFGMMLLFMVPVGLLFTLGVGIFPQEVMRLFTEDAALISEGAKYLQFACISYFSLTLNMAFSTLLRCTEQVRIPMITSGICAALNAVLNYIFIFGAFGIPAMGVAGAGLATAISSLLNPLLMLILSAIKKPSSLLAQEDIRRAGVFQNVLVARAAGAAQTSCSGASPSSASIWFSGVWERIITRRSPLSAPSKAGIRVLRWHL
jgi:putative MATE family efflux protein